MVKLCIQEGSEAVGVGLGMTVTAGRRSCDMAGGLGSHPGERRVRIMAGRARRGSNGGVPRYSHDPCSCKSAGGKV